jgi:hypothetical protein
MFMLASMFVSRRSSYASAKTTCHALMRNISGAYSDTLENTK